MMCFSNNCHFELSASQNIRGQQKVRGEKDITIMMMNRRVILRTKAVAEGVGGGAKKPVNHPLVLALLLRKDFKTALCYGGAAFLAFYGLFVSRPRLGHFQQFIVNRRALDKEFDKLFPRADELTATAKQAEAKKRDPRFVTDRSDYRVDHRLMLIENQVREMARGNGVEGVRLRVDDYYFWSLGVVSFEEPTPAAAPRRELKFVGVTMFWYNWPY